MYLCNLGSHPLAVNNGPLYNWANKTALRSIDWILAMHDFWILAVKFWMMCVYVDINGYDMGTMLHMLHVKEIVQ